MKLLDRIKRKWALLFSSPEEYARKIGVKIGQGCYISTKRFPSEAYLIEIGNYVRIAPETAFFTHGGIWALRKKYNNPDLDYFGKIVIGDYTYIGERCMIMPGVKIGSNCIIGGGTVLTKSVPDGYMVAGNPCRFIGYTENFYKKIQRLNVRTGRKSVLNKKEMLLHLSDDFFVRKKEINDIAK